MTLRSKPKRPYHPRGRLEAYNVQIQNSDSKADLRCSGPQCLLCGHCGRLCQGSEWPISFESLQTIATGMPPNKASIPSFGIPKYPATTAISEVSLGQIKKAELGATPQTVLLLQTGVGFLQGSRNSYTLPAICQKLALTSLHQSRALPVHPEGRCHYLI